MATMPRGEANLPRRDLAVAALGLDFAGGQPHAMTELPGAALEAQTVASILGRAYVNANATRARFFEAIAGARRVHVATHGAHDVSAPAFQRLYLHPDAGSDGIVYAYETVGLDLRHLDLMTLSACETALGRSGHL
jgi:CHAT domain-containing protein